MMRRTLRGGVVAALIAVGGWLCSVALAADADWPQWRGPHRDNKSADTGLLREWPKDGPPLAWKATGIGGGYSSVSIVGGKIYTMGDRRDEADLIALDAT